MSADQLRERMSYPASRSMMIMIAAVVMVVAKPRIVSGSAVVVGLAHGIGGLGEMSSLYDICAYVNTCD
jgi:hypothetical protein